jgi:ATP-dependent DNA helicase RecG
MELREINKIGPKTIELLNKLNIYNINDLISYYPYRYNIYKPINLTDYDGTDTIVINAVIDSIPKLSYIRKNLNKLSFKVLTNELLINVTIFNRAFLKNKLDVGKNIILIGKYDKVKNSFIASDLKFGSLLNTKIEPVYHTIKGIKNQNINNYILESLQNNKNFIDYIPDNINKKYNFITKEEALKIIHQPKNSYELKQAKIKLIYEELFVFMLKINFLKKRNEKLLGLEKKFDYQKIEEFIKNLPFILTPDQQAAVKDCLTDLSSKKRMNRLIQGDVGSGKTIVATITMYANTLSGYQSALMAPTEILAIQHYLNIKKLMEKENVQVGLLLGRTKKSEKNKIIEQLKNGEIDIIIGTHALISEDVAFKNLGLVITDEQHRFGVNQRSNLQNKGIRPDIIYMSATPIPRTYALVIYKDMDTSIIKTKPSGRKEIKTFVKKESELKSVLLSILDEIKKGHQIYVVAPAIEESEERDVYTVEKLKKDFDMAFHKKVSIATLHGKVKNEEKENIMNDFKNGKTKILIATTVIEVGVDVKNATTIVIFNAEYYGLATLHQLRGRVGRNDLDCFCYLISDKEVERLKVLEESNDGFYISEQDFLMRRGGDIFGTKQSGDMVFKIADLRTDFKILLQAKEDSEEFIKLGYYKDDKLKQIYNEIANLD